MCLPSPFEAFRLLLAAVHHPLARNCLGMLRTPAQSWASVWRRWPIFEPSSCLCTSGSGIPVIISTVGTAILRPPPGRGIPVLCRLRPCVECVQIQIASPALSLADSIPHRRSLQTIHQTLIAEDAQVLPFFALCP